MCDFCRARKEEMQRGYYVACSIFAIDMEKMEKYQYLTLDLNYCPNCGESFVEQDK